MPPFRICELGEIAIRCGDLDSMVDFYRDIVGLPVLNDGREDGIVFFRIREGSGGHTNVLALFDYRAGRADLHPTATAPPQTGAGSSLHHLALTVMKEDQPAIMAWLEEKGVAYRVQHFEWIKWRGIFFADPEGNTVELVAGGVLSP